MCSEQVQQDGVGGDRAQGWMCRVPHVDKLSRNESKTRECMCRRELDGGEKEFCVGGCIGSRKV